MDSTARTCAIKRAWLALALLAIIGGPTDADPVTELPSPGRGALIRGDGDSVPLAIIGDAEIVTVIHAGPAATYPELASLESRHAELRLTRLGLLARSRRLTLLVRADLAEATRVTGADLGAEPLQVVDRFLDDAALHWQPRVWASLAVGRLPVLFARSRQLERSRTSIGAVPFVIDRIAPDRRWGALFYGDIGAMSYAGGVYEDVDLLEARTSELDPSRGGHLLVAANFLWTPRAPIGASQLATPPSDPWFDTVRPAAGAGVLWRYRDGAPRLDIELSLQLKYRRYALIAELLVHTDEGGAGAAVAGELSTLVGTRAALIARGEHDDETGISALGTGMSYALTADQRNRVSAFGWLRRKSATAAPEPETQPGDADTHDVIIISFQAAF